MRLKLLALLLVFPLTTIVAETIQQGQPIDQTEIAAKKTKKKGSDPSQPAPRPYNYPVPQPAQPAQPAPMQNFIPQPAQPAQPAPTQNFVPQPAQPAQQPPPIRNYPNANQRDRKFTYQTLTQEQFYNPNNQPAQNYNQQNYQNVRVYPQQPQQEPQQQGPRRPPFRGYYRN